MSFRLRWKSLCGSEQNTISTHMVCILTAVTITRAIVLTRAIVVIIILLAIVVLIIIILLVLIIVIFLVVVIVRGCGEFFLFVPRIQR